MPDPRLVRQWTAHMRGPALQPGDAEYDAARRVWNRAIDRHPAAIVRAADTDDIRRTVELARTRDFPLAIRSGGHSQAGLGVCEGGLVLDLSGLHRVTVDAGRRTARVGAGARVMAVLEAMLPHGLVTPMGGCPEVGVGGLTVGGGESFLMGKYGAVCDNLQAVELVTADGRVLAASADEHPDLFWAVRGGGGNVGVVTAFEYRLHDAQDVLAGQFMFPAARTRDVMRRYRDLVADAPDELTTSGGLTKMSHGPAFFIAVCFCGARAEGESVVGRWQSVLRPDGDVQWSPYSADLIVPAAPSAGTGMFLPQLHDEVIEAFASAADDTPPGATAAWNDLHGAVTRVARDATAFPLRDRGFDVFISAPWEDDEGRRAATEWVALLAALLRPFGQGVYVNNLNEHEAARVAEAYGPNYRRLAAIKQAYDPDNLFRVNHNVVPATAG